MTESAGLRPLRVEPRPLSTLLDTRAGTVVTGVTLDSRRVRGGDLYVGLPGRSAHGASFASTAVSAGAVAVLTDHEGARFTDDLGVPVVVVPDPRETMASVAADVYGRPSERLLMFGVTGTAGKTSTTFLLEAGLAAAGHVVGTIGTIGFRVGGRALPSDRSTVTTPESPDLQALLAVMREHGATAVAMEVSSHALSLHRVDAIVFDVSGFTNLGRDHLDFHGDQEAYFAAKAGLFLGGRTRQAVISIDDDWGRRLADMVMADGQAQVRTCGWADDADYRVVDWSFVDAGGSRVRLRTPSGEHTFTVGLPGEFNIRNAVTAAAMIGASPLPLERALPGFASAVVPGRMQRVALGEDAPSVVVDFAHTPESVSAALSALPEGHRIAVLGCGGDRDRAKRGPMGEAAARAASVVVVTDDNPRSEDPAAIRAEVLAGARRGAADSGATVIDGGDRRSAIRIALGLAGPQTWLAILGKGHEQGQEIAGTIRPFDDVTVVGEEWAEAHTTRPPGGPDA